MTSYFFYFLFCSLYEYFHASAIAVGTHWRIAFGDAQHYGVDVGIVVEQSVGYASCHVLYEFGWSAHLLLYDVVNLGVVERVGYVVGLHSARNVIAYAYIYYIVVARELLLWQHSVACVQAYSVDVNVRFC